MATPRDAIVNAVTGKLSLLGVAPYLYLNVPQVIRHKSAAHALSQLPSVIVAAQNESYTWHGMTGVYHRELTIGIWYAFTSENQDDDAALIISDVELALADLTLGGVANDFAFVSNTLHAGDAEEPLAIVEFQCRATYRTAAATPTVRA